MKIGIVTYVKCDNYGAELQAYAMQFIYNKAGYDAEVLDLEKQSKDIATSFTTILPAVVNRFKTFGIKAPVKIAQLAIDVIKRKKAARDNKEQISEKHQLFTKFFEEKIKHSSKHYKLDEMNSTDLPYDVFVAGSDQIWNYMHTDYLEVYFLLFANRLNAKKISYAASISVPDIPKALHNRYTQLFENMDFIGVRELNAKEIVQKYSSKKATVVLDPTLLVTKEEWKKNIANELIKNKRYVLIYTLSGSKYIYELAKNIAKRIDQDCTVVNIKSNFIKENNGIEHLYSVGPEEWVGLIMNAAYVVTDSFHGTAFSINFNKPFTTLLNPSSNMNSRAQSILKITKLESRIIYDNGSHNFPDELSIDYTKVNPILEEWRTNSWSYIKESLSV